MTVKELLELNGNYGMHINIYENENEDALDYLSYMDNDKDMKEIYERFGSCRIKRWTVGSFATINIYI